MKAVEHYLEFFCLILNHKDNNNDDEFIVPAAEYEFYIESTKNLKKYNKNIEFKKLSLKPNLYKCTLNLCKSAVVNGIHTYPKIFKDSQNKIINILSENNQLSNQIIAFDYLNTILEHSEANFENMDIAAHLTNVLKSIGVNVQKYKVLDIVKDEESQNFMNVHKSFYTNRFWKDKGISNVSEILSFAVQDSLNPFYTNKDIDYVFVFISELSEIHGQSVILLQKLKHFQDHHSLQAKHLLVQHLALALENSEEQFQESLKILNFDCKGDLKSYFGKAILFKKLKKVYINSQQKKDFKLKRILITQKLYMFPADSFFGNYELFVLKFISLAKTSIEYPKVLQIFSVIFEEEKFHKHLFQGKLFVFLVKIIIY